MKIIDVQDKYQVIKTFLGLQSVKVNPQNPGDKSIKKYIKEGYENISIFLKIPSTPTPVTKTTTPQ